MQRCPSSSPGGRCPIRRRSLPGGHSRSAGLEFPPEQAKRQVDGRRGSPPRFQFTMAMTWRLAPLPRSSQSFFVSWVAEGFSTAEEEVLGGRWNRLGSTHFGHQKVIRIDAGGNPRWPVANSAGCGRSVETLERPVKWSYLPGVGVEIFVPRGTPEPLFSHLLCSTWNMMLICESREADNLAPNPGAPPYRSRGKGDEARGSPS